MFTWLTWICEDQRTTGSLQYVFHLWHYPCARLHAYCVEIECGWWTTNWNWLRRKQSWNNGKIHRKFPGGDEDTKRNSSPDSVSLPGSEQDIFEIKVRSLTDKPTYSVTEQIRCRGLLLINGFNNKFLPEYFTKHLQVRKSLTKDGWNKAELWRSNNGLHNVYWLQSINREISYKILTKSVMGHSIPTALFFKLVVPCIKIHIE